MSYILDALKKLESEREKKSRADGMVSISGALLRDEPRRTSSGVAWKVAAVVVIASLVTFGTTWFVLRADKRREHPMPPPALTAPVARATPPVAPTPAVPVPQPAPVAPPAVSAGPSAPAPRHQVAKPTAMAPAAPVADDDDAPPPPKKKSQRFKTQKNEAEVPPVEAQVTAPQAVIAPPGDIKVSGIAWQDGRSARRAVINGFLLHEGSEVSGARITEILKDRVRFSKGDKVFDAPLIMNVTPGTGR